MEAVAIDSTLSVTNFVWVDLQTQPVLRMALGGNQVGVGPAWGRGGLWLGFWVRV